MQASDIAQVAAASQRGASHNPSSAPLRVVTSGQHGNAEPPRPRQNSPVSATPRINESQWREMGFESEQQARLTLGDDFFGGPAHVRARARPSPRT